MGGRMSNRTQPFLNRPSGTDGTTRTYRPYAHLYVRVGDRYGSARSELVQAILSRLAEEFAEAIAARDWRSAAECFRAAEYLHVAERVVHGA
jgi:hypothetical protein